ncbi:hypothetical protein MKY66_04265 [Paenibacillus sp. FSL R5-0766]|uniref:hypothetical protein n=1 Tax=unclassified Paenibacillus TaxID=185978 RepID=UPI00096D4981|nr:hypothetical protein [Paenibacillus sp. FSL R5-0765]OMF61604.1 hypothetical protein BK141_20725 [Paenibacillus sp. FSL R5-0765]
MNFADKKMHSLNDAESPSGSPIVSRNARMKLRYKLTLEYETSDLRHHLVAPTLSESELAECQREPFFIFCQIK